MSSDPVIAESDTIYLTSADSNESRPNLQSSDLVVEQTFKSDSGMEEESFNHLTGLSESSDDEKDDICVKKQNRGSRRMIFDDDNDEEEKGDVREPEDINQTGEDSDTCSKRDEDNNNLSAEVSVTNSFDETKKDMTTHSLDLKTNSDLYDAELSDEDRPGYASHHEDNDMEMRNSDDDANEKSNDSNDEGFDESQLNPALAAKLKKLKGASKKGKERTKYERKSKPTAEKMLEIYSESQQMLRSSRINLPYYEPETKSLNDFLARASKKRQEYAGLKRAKDIVKAQIIQDKLSVPVLPSPPTKYQPRVRVLRDEENDAPRSNELEADSGLFTVDPRGSQQQSTLSPDSVPKTLLADDDELPDIFLKESNLVTVEDAIKSNESFLLDSQELAVQCKRTSEKAAVESDSHSLALDEQSDSQPLQLTPLIDNSSQINVVECQSHKDIPTLQKDPSMDLFSSANSLLSEHPKDAVEYSSCTSLTGQASCSAEALVLSDVSTEPVAPLCLSPRLNQSCDSKLSSSETVQKRKKSLLERLQGIELPSLPSPHLSGSPSDVICLMEPSKETPPKNPGLLKLMNKFAEHSKRRTPKAAHDVSLSIISKEGEEGTRKELRLHSLNYKVEEEETPVDDTPGSKLLKLKQQLDVGMRLKREEARQRRLQLYALENEEGFEGKKEEGEEEEMTESSSSGEEDEEEEAGPMDFGNESENEQDYNPLLDNEAKEDTDNDDDDTDDEDHSVREESENEDSNDICLHFDASDDNDDEDGEGKADGEHEDDSNSDGELLTARKKTTKKAIVESDSESADDDDDKVDAPTQILHDDDDKVDAPTQKLESQRDALSGSGRDPLKSLWSSGVSSRETDYQDKVKFRRENSKSPELYTCDKSQSQFNSAQHIENSDSSQYVTHVPTLDKDGFFKLTQKPSFKMVSEDATNRLSSLVDSGLEELTPGNIFKDNSQQATSQMFTPGNIFQDFVTQPASGGFKDDDTSQEKESLDSILHFGKDTIISEGFQSKGDSKHPGKPSTYRSFSDEDEHDVYDPFSVLTRKDDHAKPKKLKIIKPTLTDSEDEHNDSDASGGNNLASDNEDKVDRECDTDVEEACQQSERNFKFTSFKDRKKGIRQEFVEDEAELSGSEYESDEDLDLAEADDILEEEEGDKDMAGVSEDKLREEVGRVHMKRLQDDDDKQVMFLKEKYLQDGDLYSDNAGRMRNFRWKNSETDSQQDMFNLSDEEQHEEDNDEQQWRKDRYEREKFLEEIDPRPNGEDSQLLKLGHDFLKKKECSITKENLPVAKPKMAPPEPPKPKLSKKGSFLSRKDDTLIKVAQVAKSLGTASRNRKNFVFHSVDQLESQEINTNKDAAAPSKRKAHSASQSEQHVKKLKLADVPTGKLQKRRDSIFNLLN